MSNKFKAFFSNNKEALQSKTAKVGGYSFIMSIIVLGILIAVNVLVSSLPSSITQFDMSAAQLYSLTSNTKVVANNLTEDVDIYWICQAGQEDKVIERLLSVYDDLSDHLSVTQKDPDVYPTFAEKYTSDDVNNNSIVVVCGDKYRYIDYNDIYEYTTDYTTYTSTATSFDGEALITSAINYVVADELPTVYVLKGHGEQDLSDAYTTAMERANMNTEELSLLNIDAIPDDCAAILIDAPTSDISKDELTMLKDYMTNGGKIFVISGPQKDTELENLETLLTDCNVTPEKGIVIEADRDHYASSTPYVLLPTINSSDMTDDLIEDSSYIVLPIAGGLTVGTTPSGYTVTSLLDTSSEAFSKVDGYNLTTYDKEDDDITGPFSLGVSIENSTSGGQMVWISTDSLLDDDYNTYSSGANMDFVMNVTRYMVGETDDISISSKSLEYNYLTISSTAATRLKVIMIGILPIGFLLLGIFEVLDRRKLN